MSKNATQLMVYGSCVSRDMVPFLGEGYELLHYSARQSLISAMAPPSEPPCEPQLESAFQRRIVLEDLRSSVPRTLESLGSKTDVLVMDLVDERLGVIALQGGGFCTRSQELLSSGLLERTEGHSEVIAFGTDEHFALWEGAAEQFLQLLSRTGLLKKTLLIEGTFASLADDGSAANKWWHQPANFWNHSYRRYHEVLKTAGLRTHVVGEAAISSSAHKWGPAAFHYVDQAYMAMTRAVREMAGIDDPSPCTPRAE